MVLDCERSQVDRDSTSLKTAPAPTTSASSKTLETLQEKKSLVYQLSKLGFTAGANVRKKGSANSDATQKVMIIKRMDDDGVCLDDGVRQYIVPVATFKDEFTFTKLKMQIVVSTTGMSPLSHPGWAADHAKALITIALRNAFATMDCGDPGKFTVKKYPNAIIAQSEYATGALKFVPATQSLSVYNEALCKGTAYTAATDDVKFALKRQEAVNPPTGQAGWAAFFWFVGKASAAEDANMEIYIYTSGTVKLPIMRNTIAIKPGTALLLPPGKDNDVASDEDADDGAEPPLKARRRMTGKAAASAGDM